MNETWYELKDYLGQTIYEKNILQNPDYVIDSICDEIIVYDKTIPRFYKVVRTYQETGERL